MLNQFIGNMTKKTIKEGNAEIVLYGGKISKKLPVFYNPAMEINRDISVILLNEINKKDMQIALPLSGSGIRALRFLKELKKSKIKNISINDRSEKAINSIKENLILNNIKDKKKIILSNKESDLFFIESTGFDYIDIDPFGNPSPFLDLAIKRLARDGILAVTATDTSALSGTYPKVCRRKYWASPNRDEQMHETGLRILIRKVQLIGVQYEKALTPIFSYSKEHYMRIFFICKKSRKECDNILKSHNFYNKAGPLWTGNIWDKKLTKKISGSKLLKSKEKAELKEFLLKIAKESQISSMGFYDIHRICKENKLDIPKKESILQNIRKKGFKAENTHFLKTAIRSDIDKQTLIRIIKNI